jgi:hypothetical protein
MRPVLSFLIFLLLMSTGLFSKAELKINFVLYDGLNESVTIPVETKILENAERICSDLRIQQPSTYIIRIWGNNSSYLAYQKNLMGTSFPGSTGYVMGSNEMGLLNGSNLSENAEHEFAHSMSLFINGSFGNNPRWFWESVAIYESGEFKDPTTISYLKNDDFPTIAELDAGFNTGSRQIYEVGYLIGEFIVEEWGRDKLVEMIKKNGNSQNVFGLSLIEFGAQWREFVINKYFKNSADVKNQNTIRIYPNPASDYFSVRNSGSANRRLIVFDVSGKKVKEVNSVENTIDFSGLQKGIYFLNITDSGMNSTFRLIKK